MRYTPFGSASIEVSDSSSLSQYVVSASRALQTTNALYAFVGSKGPVGDPCDTFGPYESYPPS